MVEYVKTEEQIHDGSSKDSKTRKATQADFDAF